MCLDDVLATQAGVVSRVQALESGLTPQEVDRRVARRRWHPVHPRVYLVGDAPRTDEARVWAAVLWAGEGAVLSGVAAAWWLGLPVRAPSTIAVTVPRRRAVGRRPGVVVRRRTLPVADLGEHRGLPVTALPLTVLETASEIGVAFLDAVPARTVPREEVVAASERAGVGERLLAEAAERAELRARLRLAGMLRRAGVPAHVVPGRKAVVCPVHRVLVCGSGEPAPRGWATVVGTGEDAEVVAMVRERAWIAG
ncbi:hypothetical protein PSU4_30970 [Pseudonocardia sulfidoxydans NBRC 16205]|uniref:AbiEi antitoxin C-terminal domain-containing protein n=1 Tax=Pseudonocardia sulfidoxydans NBRC 16205 TaxID=1223511 RepID=A0A511DIL3_9PSEU|nr:hypothetical protein [Pseudonocardia sulfidoxydans]GEL24143.1 hypothetical protein PSU4_30970 [Pseudonocardia sulfidoxydans NBRC 16205]